MKIKSILLLAVAAMLATSASAEIAVKQIINITGSIFETSANGNTTTIQRAGQKDFIDIISTDVGYPLTNAELRSAKLVTFDFGFGLTGLYIEFYDSEVREYCLLDVSDRFWINEVSDIAGTQVNNSGRWVAILEIAIDLVDDQDVQAEFWGIGAFQSAVRLFRRGNENIQVFTAGFRSRSFPAVLDVSVDQFTDEQPGDLTIAVRSSTVIFDDLKIIIVDND